MMGKKQDYGRESAALLATSIVFLLGFLAILFVVTTSFRDPFWPTIWSGLVLFFIFALFVMTLRAKDDIQSGGMAAWFKGTKPEKLPDYSPRRVRTSKSDTAAEKAPPSADDVRDMKENSANTWVPSSVPKQNR